MIHEMLKKARDNAGKVGAANVEFRLGELEHLPIADDTSDMIISNCVINLVPDKAQVFREAFRVLKPGGRVSISDVLNIAPLPEGLRADPALLCRCVAGAVSGERTETLLREAGFVDVTISVNPKSRDTVASRAPGRSIEKCVASAMVEARKPLLNAIVDLEELFEVEFPDDAAARFTTVADVVSYLMDALQVQRGRIVTVTGTSRLPTGGRD